MPIEEGERYRLGSITFTGNKAVTNTKALRAQFDDEGWRLVQRHPDRQGPRESAKAYGALGYINFARHSEARLSTKQKKTVILDIDIDEGKQFYVSRIEFQGNTITRDRVIRRELLLEEGQVYNCAALGVQPAAPEPA